MNTSAPPTFIDRSQGNYVGKRTKKSKKRKSKRWQETDYDGTYAPDPPPISDNDINRGMINLVGRGVIPKDIDLTPAFERGAPPLQLKPAMIHRGQPAQDAK